MTKLAKIKFSLARIGFNSCQIGPNQAKDAHPTSRKSVPKIFFVFLYYGKYFLLNLKSTLKFLQGYAKYFLSNLKSTLKFLLGYTKNFLSKLQGTLKFLRGQMAESRISIPCLRKLSINLPQNQTIMTKYLRKSLYQLTTQDYGNSSQY